MTVEALWLQQGSYTAAADRALIYSVFTEGTIEGLTVGQRAAGANYSVDVQAGLAVVAGDDSANQGNYVVRNTGIVNVVIANPPGSQSRIDLIILQVRDPDAGGTAGSDATITVVTGTQAATPVAPSLPLSAIPLATILVPAGLPSVTAVVDARTFASLRLSSGTGGSGGGGLASVQSFGSSYGLELLNGRDPGVENPIVGTWYQGVLISNVAPDITLFHNGAQSLRVRASASGTMSAGTREGSVGLPVQASATYHGSFWARAFSQQRSTQARISWYTSTGVLISSTDGNAATDSNIGWGLFTVEGVAPPTAAYASLQMVVVGVALNEDHFMDDFSFTQKLVSRSKINFSAAYLEDDPANDRINHKGEVASHLFLSKFYK